MDQNTAISTCKSGCLTDCYSVLPSQSAVSDRFAKWSTYWAHQWM